MRLGLPASACLMFAALLLPACGGAEKGPTRDEQLDTLTASAEAAYARSLAAQAAVLYHRALDRARVLGDDAEITDAAFNLAVCRIELGALAEAQAALTESDAAASRAGLRVDDVAVVEAELAARMDETARALRLADELLKRTPPPVPSIRAQAHALRGLSMLNQPAAARAELSAAEACGLIEPGAASRVALLRAKLATTPGEAALAFEQQAERLHAAGRLRAAALALVDAANAHARAGQQADADQRTQRAAAALLGLGDGAAALALIDARLAGDAPLAALDRAALQSLQGEARTRSRARSGAQR